MFLVVEDQLRVSDGWVRCGRCANVFNATEDLVDVTSGEPVQIDLGSLQAGARLPDDARRGDDPARGLGNAAPVAQHAWRQTSPSAAMPLDDLPDQLLRAPSEPFDDAPPPASPPATRHAAAPAQAQAPAWALAAPAAPAATPPAPALPPSSPLAPRLATAPEPGTALLPDDSPDWATEVPGDAAAAPTVAEPPDHAEPLAAPSEPGDGAAISTDTARNAAVADSLPSEPSFVQRAAQADRWRNSPHRTGLAALAAGLGLVLLLQLAFLWRDTLAAHVPATAPAFNGLCGLLGCQLQPLRRIEQLAVDSSALTKADEATAPPGYRYRLSVQLRNRADTVVMAPALELTLSDVQGETVVRRVLRLRDFGVAAESLAPGQEMPLRLQLDTGQRRVDGYTVELFYP